MEVILLERIRKLGQMGDTVTVKDGFARNYLIPQGKALRANEVNKARFETERAQLEARNLELKGEAEQVGKKLDGEAFVAIRQAGDTGQLYGSVSSRDIAELISENGFDLERNQVLLDRPIKVLGVHEVVISLHPEVEVSIDLNVARSEEEAERQARGEDVTAALDEVEEDADDAINPEDVFEEGALPVEGLEEGDDASDTDADASASDEASDAEASDAEAEDKEAGA